MSKPRPDPYALQLPLAPSFVPAAVADELHALRRRVEHLEAALLELARERRAPNVVDFPAATPRIAAARRAAQGFR